METARREPLGMPFTLADDLDAVAGLAGEPRQQIGQRLVAPFHARRHDAAGDDAGLEQAQIVAGEIEDLGDGRDVGGGMQVDAGQAETGSSMTRNQASTGGLGSADAAGAAHGQIDGDVEHARAFGEIHAEEEDVAPAAVGQVHADGRGFAQDRERPDRRRSSSGRRRSG